MLKYLTLLGIGLVFIYTCSFAGHQWRNNNKLGAFGTLLIGVISIIFPAILLFLR